MKFPLPSCENETVSGPAARSSVSEVDVPDPENVLGPNDCAFFAGFSVERSVGLGVVSSVFVLPFVSPVESVAVPLDFVFSASVALPLAPVLFVAGAVSEEDVLLELFPDGVPVQPANPVSERPASARYFRRLIIYLQIFSVLNLPISKNTTNPRDTIIAYYQEIRIDVLIDEPAVDLPQFVHIRGIMAWYSYCRSCFRTDTGLIPFSVCIYWQYEIKLEMDNE